MKYINVHNPEDKEIKLNFRGENYFISGKTTKSFPEDIAKQWLEIFGFMSSEGQADLTTIVKNTVEETDKEVQVELVEPKKIVSKTIKK